MGSINLAGTQLNCQDGSLLCRSSPPWSCNPPGPPPQPPFHNLKTAAPTAEVQPGLQRVLEGWELEEWREAYVMSCMFPISKTSKPEDGRRRHPNSVNWRHSGLLKTLYHSEDKSELALAVYLCIKRNQAKSKADDDISRHIDFKDHLGHL